jgi:hypothetical protein
MFETAVALTRDFAEAQFQEQAAQVREHDKGPLHGKHTSLVSSSSFIAVLGEPPDGSFIKDVGQGHPDSGRHSRAANWASMMLAKVGLHVQPVSSVFLSIVEDQDDGIVFIQPEQYITKRIAAPILEGKATGQEALSCTWTMRAFKNSREICRLLHCGIARSRLRS